jgi:hypothetical protein
MDSVFVTPDGLVFASTEEEFTQDSSLVEPLEVQNLKYEIDLISPSRKEVRLKAKNINGSYKDEFFITSIPSINRNVENQISFEGDLYESNILEIAETGDFEFTKKMEKASITINDVYKVDTLSSPATTELNFVKNGDFENLLSGLGMRHCMMMQSALMNGILALVDTMIQKILEDLFMELKPSVIMQRLF